MNCPNCKAGNAEDARFCGTCGHTLSATEASNPKMAAGGVPEAPSLIGREIAGRYRIQAKLGEGGMGAVYKAEQISLKRTCAVKLLRPEVAGSQMLLRRFNAEAELVAKLSHPNIVGIYDFGQDSDGTLFIAMEFIEGKSLRDVIHKEAPLPLRRALSIASQVAASLVEAHSHGIIHRDLKPDNVMLQDRGRQRDVVRVLDFGIAKLRDENRQSQLAMTQAGDMLGTPQYMAPEQIRGENIDGRTDIYSLGGLLYEMVTGRLPFEAPTVMALLSKHLLENIVPPSQRRPDLVIPPALDMLIMNAMAKEPSARAATMEQFQEEINSVLATFPADSGQQTAQSTAQQPAVTRSQPAQMPPPAFGATAAVGGPPPGVFTPPTPPPPGPASGFVPTSPTTPSHGSPVVAMTQPNAAYNAPPAGVPYDPYANMNAAPAPAPKPASGGKGIYVLLALLVLGGIGTGVYFGVIRKSGGGGGGGGGSGSSGSAGSAGSAVVENPPPTPDAAESGTPPPAVDAKALDPGDDPWAKGSGTTIPNNGGGDDDGSDVGDDTPTNGVGASGLPESCDELLDMMEALGTCQGMPEVQRKQMKQAADQIRKEYANMKNLPPSTMKQVGESCRQSLDAMKQAAGAYNCGS